MQILHKSTNYIITIKHTKEDFAQLNDWLEQNCMSYNYDHSVKFNGGDPIIYLEIYNKDDYTKFKLTWE